MVPPFPARVLLAFLACLAGFPLFADPRAEPADLVLWYERPAVEWVEALPVGNGRLGAMVFGGINLERLQLNEDTLWAGGPYNPANPAARESLPEIRRLLAEGQYAKAQALAQESFMSVPLREMPYQSLGDLLISMPGSEKTFEYRRELDLDTATVLTRFTLGGVTYRREVFVSPVDDVLVVRIESENRSGWGGDDRLRFSLSMQSPLQASVSTRDGHTLIMAGRNGAANGIEGALAFETRLHVLLDDGQGRVTASGQQLHVSGARTATLLVSAATSYRSYDDVGGDPATLNESRIAKAARRSIDELRDAHQAEHQRLFRRVSIDLGSSPAAERPTDQRIAAFAQGNDPALVALYLQYARYLLISSSRPGTQPANLQGIWNDSIDPPWGSNYTININTQMNYWPAQATALPEMAEPLHRMIAELSQTGARFARDHYGTGGWVAHHNTDLWRAAGPFDGAFWGLWPTGGAWLTTHLWEHFLYSGDRDFLAEYWPVMRGAAQFFLDNLVETPDGTLVSSPSISPENAHHPELSIAAGPAMDNQILRDLFAQTASAADILGVEGDFAGRLRTVRARLAPDRVGAQGQLQEWRQDWDADAPEPTHRHVSHLYALHPSAQITPRGTPELAVAARNSLEARGDLTTGWAIAWRINLWARLLEGDRAFEVMKLLLSPDRSYPNLFDAHPPFQIDGNFGGASAITGMLLQSHVRLNDADPAGGDLRFELELLPALPAALPSGRVSGLRARGGFEVDLQWSEGCLLQADVRSRLGREVRLRYGDETKGLNQGTGERITWHPKGCQSRGSS